MISFSQLASLTLAALLATNSAAQAAPKPPVPPVPADAGRTWLAGDHHIHSEYSVGWKPNPEDPSLAPTPILGGDAIYPILKNTQMARDHGLSWMVSTDHGGPNHSKLNAERAYPDVLRARIAVPEVIQFYGMEFDTPGADHSSLIIPRTDAERETLFSIESRFAKHEAWPRDKARDTEPKMLEALAFMRALEAPPVVFANHPSRSAEELYGYGLDNPSELRAWNDTAPNVAVGMEGAPGHQAAALAPDGSIKPDGNRGSYRRAPTLGGFDAMSARLGGFWDSLLGEGRRWWITATSDSHKHFTEGGVDFWPGEYSKTYVYAQKNHEDILDGLRHGRIFVVTGDLISALDVKAFTGKTRAPKSQAEIGGTLNVKAGQDVNLSLTIRDPAGANFGGRTPELARVDIIMGDVTVGQSDPNLDRNPSTRVIARLTPTEWKRDGEIITATYLVPKVSKNSYIRFRGTNTQELEPAPDPDGENPWDDLWFYSNPIFVQVK
jgi:hypothetical protein